MLATARSSGLRWATRRLLSTSAVEPAAAGAAGAPPPPRATQIRRVGRREAIWARRRELVGGAEPPPALQRFAERSLLDSAPSAIVALDARVFGADVRVDVVHSAVRWQLANRRQGGRTSKTVADVSGSNAKMGNQKGGGRARHGMKRRNIFRGGGKAHGSKMRDYSFSLPKKLRWMALRSALSARVAEGRCVIVEDGSLPSHRTKDFVENVLAPRGWDAASTLFCDVHAHPNLLLASRNFRKFDAVRAIDVSTLDVLKRSQLVLTTAAVEVLSERLTKLMR